MARPAPPQETSRGAAGGGVGTVATNAAMMMPMIASTVIVSTIFCAHVPGVVPM